MATRRTRVKNAFFDRLTDIIVSSPQGLIAFLVVSLVILISLGFLFASLFKFLWILIIGLGGYVSYVILTKKK